MHIIYNGREREVPDGCSVAELLETLRLNDKPVAVEVNLDLVPRESHGHRALQEGDAVEVVTLVGGG